MRALWLGVAFAIAIASTVPAAAIGVYKDRFDAVVSHFGSSLLGTWVFHPDYMYSDIAGTQTAVSDGRLGRVASYVPGAPDLIAVSDIRRPTVRTVDGPISGVEYVAWQGQQGSPTGSRWLQTETDIGLTTTEFTIAINGFIPFFDTGPQQVLWYVMGANAGLTSPGSTGVVRVFDSTDSNDYLMSRIRLDNGTDASRRGFHFGDFDDFVPTIWDARGGGDPNSPSTDREMRTWQANANGDLVVLPFSQQETNLGAATLADGRLTLGSATSGHNGANAFFAGSVIILDRLTANDFERDLLAFALQPIPWLVE